MDGVRLGIRVAASLPAAVCVKVKRFEARRRNVKPVTLRCRVKSLGGSARNEDGEESKRQCFQRKSVSRILYYL